MRYNPYESYFTQAGLPTAQGQQLLARVADTDSPVFTGAPVAPSYSVSGLPDVVMGGFIYVADESGGANLAFSDGVNWRRVSDRAIVT